MKVIIAIAGGIILFLLMIWVLPSPVTEEEKIEYIKQVQLINNHEQHREELGVKSTYLRQSYDYTLLYERMLKAFEKQNELMKELIELNKQK